MKQLQRILKFLGQVCLAFLICFGIYKSYGFYQQNKIERLQIEKKQLSSSQKPFVIVISGHNNSLYCEKSLLSTMTQNYGNFRVIYIDDASTDDSFSKISFAVAQSPKKDKISLVKSKESQGLLSTLYDVICSCEDQEIVLLLDGHDFLAHENVLAKLNKVYAKPSTWMTYGNFLDYPSYRQIPIKCKQIPKNVIFNNSFRSYDIQDMHLKTFYAALFKQIRKEDLLYKGKFLSSDGALAYLLPLLEMSGKHACFINDVLYLHTRSQPPLSLECLSYIRKLPKYKRLKNLFSNDPIQETQSI